MLLDGLELLGGLLAVPVERSLEAAGVAAAERAPEAGTGTGDEVDIAAALLRLSGPTSLSEWAAGPEVSNVGAGLVRAKLAGVELVGADNGLVELVEGVLVDGDARPAEGRLVDAALSEPGLVDNVDGLVKAVLDVQAVLAEAELVDVDARLADGRLVDVALAESGPVDADGLVKAHGTAAAAD